MKKAICLPDALGESRKRRYADNGFGGQGFGVGVGSESKITNGVSA